jgi:hypothetical protein
MRETRAFVTITGQEGLVASDEQRHPEA